MPEILATENTLVFFVNGKKIEDDNVDPEWTLLYYLRNKLRLCGTKLGCGEGGCGACTVMVTKYDRWEKKEIHIPVNACLAPVCAMHGLSVITVEGIGSTRTKLHPVQERIAKAHGSQCGFCTPGIVMSMYTLLRQYGKPTMKEMEVAFQGNLCRCTGYRPIIEGYRTFTEEWELQQNAQKLNGNVACGMGEKCCKFNKMNGYQKPHHLNDRDQKPDHTSDHHQKPDHTNDHHQKADHTNDHHQKPDRTNDHHQKPDHANDHHQKPNHTNDHQQKPDHTNDYHQKSNHTNDHDQKPDHINDHGQKPDYTKLNGTNYSQCNGNSSINSTTNSTNSKDEVLFKQNEFVPYDSSQEPIFPPELKLTDKYDRQYLIIKGENVTWYRPTRLDQFLDLKAKFPNAKVVVGNSEVGVEVKFKHMIYPVLIQPSLIPEMVEIRTTNDGVRVGASVTLMQVHEFLMQVIRSLPEEKTRMFLAITEMLHWFAGKQIRSVGALGSNIMTGSPISDMIPVLMAARVKLELLSKQDGHRTVNLDNNFFVGYRKSIVQPHEILLAINIPYTTKDQYFHAYKQARRRDDDIAIVNTAVNVTFKPGTHIISDIGLAFGGMSFKTVMAPKTEAKLINLPWTRDTLEIAYANLLEDLPLDPGAPGGMIQYRRSLPLSLFFKAFLAISQKLTNYIPEVKIQPEEVSGSTGFHALDLKSSQYFTVVPSTQEKTNALRRPMVHTSAYKQACGEAVYCDDIPYFENELYMAFVLSTEAHAKVLSIDASEALAMDGVHAFFSGKDVDPKHAKIGSIVHDEYVFYSEKVTSQGQVVGAIVADNQTIAQRAARKVKVQYEKLEPVVVSIEDAIKHNSYFAKPHKILVKGDIEEVFRKAPHIIEGECRMGGQEHFYLETQACIAVPKREDYEMEIYSSTQNPTELSKLIAEVLGVHQNRIITKVKRIGGGFGGKESKSIIVGIPAALAASKLGRPIRVMLDRDEDIIMTGGRHPFMMRYKIAFDDNGKWLGCKMDVYCNAGYSTDLTPSVLERSMTHFENSYKCPVVHITGYICKTNLPSNTAFRGFGGPQGMFSGECMMQHVADYLGKDVVELSQLNLYNEGDVTHYNQKLINSSNVTCWEECKKSSNFHERRKQVQKFNRENKYKKRGISLIPTKYGIAFTAPFLNQGGALILVYTDGSVLLSHGGIEMGQGLYTKTIQVASAVLEIPVEKIHIAETATDKVPNTSPTAGSTGSDINGAAVMEACKVIKERLRPYKEANPDGTWEDWVRKAYFDRVSLSATGFHKTPDIGFNWVTGEGNMFNYFTYGAACSEVEIDTLTGDHQVLRTDIVMDLGESLNPAIDIGQIEGAFMQGYGLFVLEEMVYSPTGMTFTRGPGTYKIPGFADIPAEFNVSLLKGVSNPRAVYSSKAVGEPPLFLASSVFFAIKDAIKAARLENGVTASFRLDAPATSAKIRMACKDNITSRLKEPEPGSYKPWNVIA